MEAALDRMGGWDVYAEIARTFADALPGERLPPALRRQWTSHRFPCKA